MVKVKENVEDVIRIEVLLEDMDYTFVGDAFMKLVRTLAFAVMNKNKIKNVL
jgi:hypothetical protein